MSFLVPMILMPALVSLIVPPPGSEWPFAANVLMWTGIFTMFSVLALTLKKLFGRAPSLTEVLAGLVTTSALIEMKKQHDETFEDYRKAQHARHRGLEEQLAKLRHDSQGEDQLLRLRIEERQQEIGSMRDQVSRLTERTESHIRKLDQYDTKIDNLLKDMLRAARNLPGN